MKELGLYEKGVEKLRAYKHEQKVVNTWFFVQEMKMKFTEELRKQGIVPESPEGQSRLLCALAEQIPLDLPPGSVFAGTQDVAFSPSYALINPTFKVETFAGYCDPCAIYDDVVLEPGIDKNRVENVRSYYANDPYTKALTEHYHNFENDTAEVAYFMEPVTGHTIPDVRPYLKQGINKMQNAVPAGEYGKSMKRSMEAVKILGARYYKLAVEKAAAEQDPEEKQRLTELAERLTRVPAEGARNLPEAMQLFILLWMSMVLEQAPNPYAFSVGNMDRIFEPYMNDTQFEDAVSYCRHLLAFFIVGSRGWAISQNIMVGGRDSKGNDLSSAATRMVLEAFFRSNDPQPALSAKIHEKTPDAFFDDLGRFFSTPGHSTASLFNDDSMFEMLRKEGVADADLADYSIAGCQEPLIMGKTSLNTTNTWLNLGKILELALNDGKSMLSDKQIGPSWKDFGYASETDAYAHAGELFDKMLNHFLPRMEAAGNGCTTILGKYKPVPLTSALHDSMSSGRDLRDPLHPGTRYNGSGCLIHGLAVVADSLQAVKKALPLFGEKKLHEALKANFAGFEDVQEFLLGCEKYGNNIAEADDAVVKLAHSVAVRVRQLKNPAGYHYCADYSTPSTHLLYGYWVAATPDGRKARTMLNYGIDPLPQSVKVQLQDKLISMRKLNFHDMNGGYASHIGIQCMADSLKDPGAWMRDRVIRPLFHSSANGQAPFYVYFNIDSAEHLRKLLQDPKKYAPSGVYILRIHGTFVNFLDLSKAIQEDIIRRLEGDVA